MADLLGARPAVLREGVSSREEESAARVFLAGNGLTHVLRGEETVREGVSVGRDARDIAICSSSSVGKKKRRERKERRSEKAFCGCILIDGETLFAINHPNGAMAEGENDRNESVA